MEIEKYGMDELEEARRLQDKCMDLHLPPPPVVSYMAQVFEGEELLRELHSKSNTFTRNGYNLIAYYGGCVAETNVNNTFADGTICLKNHDTGTLFTQLNRSPSSYQTRIGTSGTAYNIDDYQLTGSGLLTGVLSTTSVFDAGSRKMVTTLVTNRIHTGAVATVREAGIVAFYSNTAQPVLVCRDVIPPITLNPGQQLIFTYQVEVAYPL